ncbi:hypothetical protein JHD50_06815 [Sulfurimonas sp. MAG313]|nr:hypothetical protein [Sulfurimonas sp. MAG313]MDF1881017.1 hypothetical protein [Sulfurimonas sp. MAG313]
MELKDVILSTLEELEHTKEELIPQEKDEKNILNLDDKPSETSKVLSPTHNEEIFLENMRERVHVLFEGFQSPNNANIEAKVDLTLNFLEYLLSSIETRLKEIK